jgi:hypothetical protein
MEGIQKSKKNTKMVKATPIDFLGKTYDSTRGETALWSAVITQALMDALTRSRNPEALYSKHTAIAWLTGNSKDFIMVCLCAGFEPDYVRKKAKRAIASPQRWRAEPGKGKRYLERKKYRNTKSSKSTESPPVAPVNEYA